ncbi:MAG: hypothetical protein SFY56_07990 [Bacteroidota bacterium]|nr:hypothetical protein [Bacteroidota bacterium]
MLNIKHLISLIIACLLLLFTIPLFLLGIVTGPQDIHYVNIFLLLLKTTVCIIVILALKKNKWNKYILETKGIILTSLIISMISILFSLALIKYKYGYINWKYKDILTFENPFDEKKYSVFATNWLNSYKDGVLTYYQRFNKYPKKLEKLKNLEPFKDSEHFCDPWGTKIYYLQNNNTIILRSAGADKIFNYKDDILVSNKLFRPQ